MGLTRDDPPPQGPQGSSLVPPGGPTTRSSSPTALSAELFLRVQAQQEIIDALNDIGTQLDDPSDSPVLTEVLIMLEQVEELHSTFRTEHGWLVTQWPPAHLDHSYFTMKTNATEAKLVLKLKRQLGRIKEQLAETAQPASSTQPAPRTRSRLPELSVPSFSGDTIKWPNFKAMFTSVIGNRSDITDLEKFQYLKGAVSGDASELIINLTPDPSSYEAAWQLLNARYENKRLIVKSHMERLLALKPMTKRQASSLMKMVNIINETTQTLKTFTNDTNNDCIMVTLVTGLLDRDTREKWENSLASNNDFPTLTQLIEFLSARARTLENLEENVPSTQSTGAKGATPKRANSHQTSQSQSTSSSKPTTQQGSQPSQQRAIYPCDCCGEDHYIVMCPKLRGYSLAQRVQVVKDKSLCFNCLGRHNARKCNNSRHCKTCNNAHHTMLHGADLSSTASNVNENSQSAKEAAEASTTTSVDSLKETSHLTLLATATAKVLTTSSSCQVRVLVDPGSEVSFITERLTNQLNLKRRHAKLDIYGVGGRKTSQTKGVVSLILHSRYRPLSVTVETHILSTVTTILPTCETTQEHDWPHLKGLNLADPDFLTPRPIDIIVGADFYGQIIKPNVIRHSSAAPIAQLSIFGWLVIGPISSPVTISRATHHGVTQSPHPPLEDLLVKFWIQEEPPTAPYSQLTPEEQECEQHFEATHSRDSSGRYIVRIPLKSSPTALGDSYQTAHHCLRRILKRLDKDSQYSLLYTQFMREYEQCQHMTKLTANSVNTQAHFYLPHHGVLKPESSSTKLRVVFNGSSASSTGCSVNDLMHTGPNLMLNIFDLLIWIRRHKFLFATDITKMYRQISIHPADRDLQRILWIDEQGQEVHYQLTTVTYGTKSAPYLAVRTLLQLAKDEGSKYPRAVEPITRGRYVDDIFGGSDSVDTLIQTACDLTQLCHAGGFPLAKWHSTTKELLKAVSTEPHNSSTISFDDCNTKILGIRWSPHQDTFNFSTISSTHSNRFSKRLVSSEVAQLFDPLGFTAPVVIRAKMFLQELWLHKLNWDETLPEQLVSQWLSIRHDLTSLAGLAIPRWFNTCPHATVELHGFADASQFAMAAVVYLVVNSPSTGTSASLICSKTKVAPLKRLTIPRLELTAALLLATLTDHVYATLDMNISNVHLWTDSQVTLSWIKAHPSRWKDYVRNRVTKIQELSEKAHWRHVPGTSNPADCASRGITTEQLEQHPLWWSGPPWMTEPEDSWPAQLDSAVDDSCAQEARANVSLHATLSTEKHEWDLVHRFSSLTKLLRITALCVKFTKRLARRLDSSPPALITSIDVENSRLHWVKATQAAYFHEELSLLSNGKQVPTSNPLCKLTAFIDDDGVLRVGGRLSNANLSYNHKHPAILPRAARFSELITAHAHKQTMHGGTQSTLALIRQLYWIMGGRAPVKSHILRCVVCARQRGIRAQQLMGQLPQARVTPSRPFSHTGIDYAGPLTLKTWKGRSAKTDKGWICVFVCLATSATHLEVVSDYTADGFIATYKRFTSRRGIPAALYSDCGTNFVGADAQLKQCFAESSAGHNEIAHRLAQEHTQWHFNPPAAPHMGGKWEAVVKSLKFHLRRTVGDTLLTYEETSTLLTQIEAILNSRPLEPLSDDPEDTSALTPGHFLIGTALNAIPEPSLLEIPTSRLSRWQLIQQKMQQFWHLWSSQYLQRLQAVSKWHHPHNNLQVGSLVLLTDERLAPGKWPLARFSSLKIGLGSQAATRQGRTHQSGVTQNSHHNAHTSNCQARPTSHRDSRRHSSPIINIVADSPRECLGTNVSTTATTLSLTVNASHATASREDAP